MSTPKTATPLLSAVKAVVNELRRLEDKWAPEYDVGEQAYGHAADLLDDAIKQASDHKQIGNK